jgi:hypothetical protein
MNGRKRLCTLLAPQLGFLCGMILEANESKFFFNGMIFGSFIMQNYVD